MYPHGRLTYKTPFGSGMEQQLPFKILISFDKFVRYYEELAKSGNKFERNKAARILEAQKPYPELREGFTDVATLEKHREVLQILLTDAFSGVLSDNEIKAVSLPYVNVLFNPSRRLKKILEAAGPGYEPILQNGDEDFDYIMACTVILNFYFGYHLDFTRPYTFQIPSAEGVMHYYRVMYNADFMEIIPQKGAPEITQKDVDELLARPHDVEFWKSKIPPNSFVSNGFVIANLFNATSEYAISAIKSSLIGRMDRRTENFIDGLEDTFRSFFDLQDLKIGFITYSEYRNAFEKVEGNRVKSFILKDQSAKECKKALCIGSYEKLIEQHSYHVVPDVAKFLENSKGNALYKGLLKQGIESAIFAPITDQGELLGVLELVSARANVLNGVNATKLDDVMPYLAATISRTKTEEANLIDAVIQHECTTIHDSVLWRFKEEARRFIRSDEEGKRPNFKEISFRDVHPLFGQVDIKGSSEARNSAVQKDLLIQLSAIRSILQRLLDDFGLPIYEELIFRVNEHMTEINELLLNNAEQSIFNFVREEIIPVFRHVKTLDKDLRDLVKFYEEGIDSEMQAYYDHRKNYDISVRQINQSLTRHLDQRQEEAQKMFPHYYERYQTDGVEHNMYIGTSIVQDRTFDHLYLQNLRLWQLQVMCEMENAHYRIKPTLPISLDVASLIMVHNTEITIRFRMDEKRFDVDGTYNARYEIIKKRIDKAYIKGKRERLTQPGKMVIVYSQKSDELEYLGYISFLRSKGYFTDAIEIVDLESVQGVSGLKAIRADILYSRDAEEQRTYTYQDLMETLES